MKEPTPESQSTNDVTRVALNRLHGAEAMDISPRLLDGLIAGRRANGFPVVYLNSKPIIPVDLLREWLRKEAQRKGGR